jgi:HSP20 family protein
MEIERWEPWREFEELLRRFNEMMDEFFSSSLMVNMPRRPSFSPLVDMYESARGLVVRASLPGVIEEDIDITFEGDSLVLRGESGGPLDAVDEGYRLQECRYGYFERRLELPRGFDTGNASFEYREGVLEIRLPRQAGEPE